MKRHTQKKRFAPKRKKNHFLLVAFFIVLGLPLLAGAFFVSTFNLDAHRERIAQALSKQTGRRIELRGPLSWRFSLDHGISVGAANVLIGNPAWASRPVMAQVGKARLHVNLRSLLGGRLDVESFEMARADILLETGADGKGNWVFASLPPGPPDEDIGFFKKKKKDKAAPIPMNLNVRRAEIADSRLGVRDAAGKLTIFDVPQLVFEETESGIKVSFRGEIASVPARIDLSGGGLQSMADASWPFGIEARFGAMEVKGNGRLNLRKSEALFDQASLQTGRTNIAAQGGLIFGGARPFLRGKIESGRIDIADLSPGAPADKGVVGYLAEKNPIVSKKSGRIFSDEALPLDGLKVLDAELVFAVREVVWGPIFAKDVEGKLVLSGGNLLLSPFSAGLAGSEVKGQIRLDAREKDAQIEAILKGTGLDFSKLLDLGGMESFISGKADLALDVRTQGRSTRDFAAHSMGTLSLLMDSGTVSSSGVKSVAGELVDIFLPGVRTLASPGVKCMAARYVVTNGLVETKGLLIDMDNATVAGAGTINLPEERINMSLRTRPKGIGVGAMVPPAKITGDLSSPSVTLDAGKTLENVAGLLMSGDGGGGVPRMLHIDGRNDCAVTLDNLAFALRPETSKRNAPLLSEGEGLIDNVKDIGHKLFQGIGSNFFGK